MRTPVLLAAVLVCTCLVGAVRAGSPPIEPLADVRAIDGSGNNVVHPEWGSAGESLLRPEPAAYEDGISAPPTTGLPSPREVSNAVAAQSGPILSSVGFTDLFWLWGQFLDHDVDLTPPAVPLEPFPIPVPLGDPWFDPQGTGTEEIPLFRSAHVEPQGVREQVNAITAFIDASNVYGSDAARAAELRALDGTGRLKTSAGDLLPFNVNGFPNAPDDLDPSFFLAGDVRANEHVGLTALHTLFMREHNFLADWFRLEAPEMTGDEIYELARAIVGAEVQVITYHEFLPILLGPDAIGTSTGYDVVSNPGVDNVFSTAAYRVGHTMLSSQLLRLEESGVPIPEGNLALRDAFFAPQEILQAGGIEPLLRGVASQVAQEVDPYVVDEVRNFLFGPPGSGGFDLASLNLQRGRDHGLARYNQGRRDLGLPARADFSQISSDPEVQARLASVYASVEDVDFWIGGLAEDPVNAGVVGETFYHLLKRQFARLRDCDRFWYERHLPAEWVGWVRGQTLAAIIRRNTPIDSIQEKVFLIENATGVTLAALPPEGFGLGAPRPNPTRDRTTLDLSVPETWTGPVDVAVFDVTGRRVATLLRGPVTGGGRTLSWDRRSEEGRPAPPGVYFVRAGAGSFADARKVVVVGTR